MGHGGIEGHLTVFSHFRVNWQGKKMPMPAYFQCRYKITLNFPDFPAIIPNTPMPKGRPAELFPVEQLIVMEDQRVPLEKMNKQLSDKLLQVSIQNSNIVFS